MKKYIKYIIVTIILFFVFVATLSISRKDEDMQKNVSTISSSNTQKSEKNTTIKSEKEKETEEVSIAVETIYHENVGIDKLIADYNKLAEIQITKDMVTEGSYSVNANITINDVTMIIYNTESSISIDYSYEGENDEAIYPFFRDFSRALNPKLSNKKIKIAWIDIKKGTYKNTSFYNLNGIEVTYITGEVDSKNNHYIIRTKQNY